MAIPLLGLQGSSITVRKANKLGLRPSFPFLISVPVKKVIAAHPHCCFLVVIIRTDIPTHFFYFAQQGVCHTFFNHAIFAV